MMLREGGETGGGGGGGGEGGEVAFHPACGLVSKHCRHFMEKRGWSLSVWPRGCVVEKEHLTLT